jgi:hypothetical protein
LVKRKMANRGLNSFFRGSIRGRKSEEKLAEQVLFLFQVFDRRLVKNWVTNYLLLVGNLSVENSTSLYKLAACSQEEL